MTQMEAGKGRPTHFLTKIYFLDGESKDSSIAHKTDM
jgi:hypothetical protein